MAKGAALKKIPIARPTKKLAIASAQMKKLAKGKGVKQLYKAIPKNMSAKSPHKRTGSAWAGPRAIAKAAKGVKNKFSNPLAKGVLRTAAKVGKLGIKSAMPGAAGAVGAAKLLPSLAKGIGREKVSGQLMKMGSNAL